jgi:hypothetical protein
MDKFLALFSDSNQKIMEHACATHDLCNIKNIVDVYRHKPDLLFGIQGFSAQCWDELTAALSNPANPYIPADAVISYAKAQLIVKRNHLIDELSELSGTIRAMD